MRDFQNILKMYLEADGVPETPAPATAPPGSFSGSIEDAETPTAAFQAFKGEYDKLVASLKQGVEQSVGQLDKLHTQAAGFQKSVGHQSYDPSNFAAAPDAAKAPPVMDPNKLKSMQGFWAKRKAAMGGVNPAGNVGGI